MALSAMGLTLMNHCVLMRGSMMSLLRSQRPMTISCGLLANEVAARIEVGQDAAARLVELQAGVRGAVVVDPAVVGHDVDHRQAVALAGLEVVGVVGRRDLDRAGAEVAPHDVVGDDRHDRARRTG